MASGTPSPVTAQIRSKKVDFPCPRRLRAFLDTMVSDLYAVRGRAGINVRLRQFPDGTEINADTQGGSPPTQLPETPFQVIPVTLDDGTAGVGVISNSHLFNSEDRDTYEEDNTDWGLLDDDATGVQGFIPITDLNLGDKIWIGIELDPNDQSIISIDIEWGAVGGGLWDEWPDPIGINTDDPANPYQQFYNQIIAEVTDPDQDPRDGIQLVRPGTGHEDGQRLQITQLLFADLMMTTAHTTNDADQPDIPLLVAIPWMVAPGTALDGSADELPMDEDQMTPWQIGSSETLNDYAFEMFNASDEEGAKVLILDGQVYGPNDEGQMPEGMGNDDYILPVANDDEIWVGFTWQDSFITSVWIDHGPATPDDEAQVQYITIGYVQVDDGPVPIVHPTNAQCGDIIVALPKSEDVSEDVPELVLVQDTDDGTVRWLESTLCDCTDGGNTDGGSSSNF